MFARTGSQHPLLWMMLIGIILGGVCFSGSLQSDIILVIDTSGSMMSVLPAIQGASLEFIDGLSDSAFVFLGSFHEKNELRFSGPLSPVNRQRLSESIKSLAPVGQWTHFRAAADLLQKLELDSSRHYSLLLFTDQLSDPRPGFDDIDLVEFQSTIPSFIDTYIISSPEVLKTFSISDSLGKTQIDSSLTGIAVDLTSSQNIFEQMQSIFEGQILRQAIKPKPRLSWFKLGLLFSLGVSILALPIFYQSMQKRRFNIFVARPLWQIEARLNDRIIADKILHDGEQTTIGSDGDVNIKELPPLAAKITYDKHVKANLYVEAKLNGRQIKGKVKLTNADKVYLEDHIMVSFQQLGKKTGAPQEHPEQAAELTI
jgi:hypothetical protein